MTDWKDRQRALWLLEDYYQIREAAGRGEATDYHKRYDQNDSEDREGRMINAYWSIGSRVWRDK